MWNIDEESSGSDGSDDDEVTTPHDEEIRTPFSDESLDPFKMLLPFCKVSNLTSRRTDVRLRFAFRLILSTRNTLYLHIYPRRD